MRIFLNIQIFLLSTMKRSESKLWFEQMLANTNRMLNLDETEIL